MRYPAYVFLEKVFNNSAPYIHPYYGKICWTVVYDGTGNPDCQEDHVLFSKEMSKQVAKDYVEIFVDGLGIVKTSGRFLKGWGLKAIKEDNEVLYWIPFNWYKYFKKNNILHWKRDKNECCN